MPATFSIGVDTAFSVLKIVTAGFFMPDDVERLRAQLDDAHRQLRCPPNRHRTLLDIREMAIQSQESFRAFAQLVNDPATRSRAIAIVAAKSLARMQMERATASRPEAAFFMNDMPAAERWLMER